MYLHINIQNIITEYYIKYLYRPTIDFLICRYQLGTKLPYNIVIEIHNISDIGTVIYKKLSLMLYDIFPPLGPVL